MPPKPEIAGGGLNKYQEVEFAPPWMGSRHVLKQGPHHLGAHAGKETLCKFYTRCSCASLRPWYSDQVCTAEQHVVGVEECQVD